MPVIAWFLSPIGRYVGIFLIVIAVAGGIYWKIRSDAREEIQLEILQNSLESIENAVRAGDALSNDPKRLREPDKACRDCE